MDLTEFIADSLVTVHGFLAGLSGQPMWSLEKDEAGKLGSAITNVTRHYDIPGFDQKAVDWFRLFQMAGMVYGTRIFAANMMAKSNRAKPVNPSPPMTATETNVQTQTERPPQNDRARAGGTMASPGPGLPPVWVPDPPAN